MSSPAPENRLIIYQLLVRQFANQGSPNIAGANWSVNGSGTLDGISNEILSNIRNLGCNAVWLTGIVRHASRSDKPATKEIATHPALVKGMAGSPYAIQDFFSLDPDILSRPENPMAELGDCLKRIHASGMKAIMDFVPNHCARFYHSDAAKRRGLINPGEEDDASQEFFAGNCFYYLPDQKLKLPVEDSGEYDWAYTEFPARATGNDCFRSDPGINDWYETVKFNYGINYLTGDTHFQPHPPIWNYMREVLLFWAEKGMDGFRCDMAEMVPLEFWKWVIAEIKSAFPEVIFIAEVYNPDLYRAFLDAGFDYQYDKAGMYDCLRAIMEGHGDCRQLTSVWQQQEGIQHQMLRFLENHDEQRIASRFFAGNAQAGIPAFAAAAFSGRAALMLYAGQEFGEKAEHEEGFSGDDGRSSIFDYGCVPSIQKWLNEIYLANQNNFIPEENLRRAYQQILHLLQKEPALAGPHFYDLQYANPDSAKYDARRIWSFLRFDENHKLLIICSFSKNESRIQLTIPSHAMAILKLTDHEKIRIDHLENNFRLTKIIELRSYENSSDLILKDLPVPPLSYSIFRIQSIT